MSFPRYPGYKDSGVEWLGMVPEHWNLRRIGYFFSERREKVSDKEFPALSVTKNGIVPQLETAAKSDDGENRKRVCAGDFVINSRSDRNGSAGVSELDGSVSLICTVLEPLEHVHASFVHHLLRSLPFQEEFYRNGKGIVADLWSTNYSEMRNILLGMPPRTEQAQIATFLDRETTKIDALVAEQRRLMELLKEKRQAVISHAVTKGLNPNAPMKPSGIEWLGDVPEHWQVSRYKNALSIFQGMAFKSSDYVDYSGTVNIRMGNIRKGGFINLEHNVKYLPDSFADSYAEYVLRENDLIIAMTDMSPSLEFLAVPAIIKGLDATCTYLLNQRVGRLTINSQYQVEFVKYLLLSDGLRNQLKFLGLGTVQSNMSNEDLYCTYFASPPPPEQITIVRFLANATKNMDMLLSEAQRAIDLLQERRTALISAAVTGQIDVRDLSGEIAA